VTAGPQYDVRRCAVSPDGKWVATGSHWPSTERPTNPTSASEQLGNVRVWDTSTGQLLQSFPVGNLTDVWFSPHGRWLATSSSVDGDCRLWRTGTWEAGPRFPSAKDVTFSPDERLVALGGKPGQIQLCETDSGREIGILPVAEGAVAIPSCFSPDGTRLYGKTAWDTTLIHAWDLRRIRDGLREI